jgi:hypothetical protein
VNASEKVLDAIRLLTERYDGPIAVGQRFLYWTHIQRTYNVAIYVIVESIEGSWLCLNDNGGAIHVREERFRGHCKPL